MIKTDKLIFAYPGETEPVDVLKGIDLSIEEGQFVAILGHNGSGKSTLARQLNALLLPSAGTVWINGKDTKSLENLWYIRQNMGMVFQNPDNQLIATVVEEDVAFGPENLGVPSGEIRQRVDTTLKQVGMEAFALSAPHTLSGGQKQRVAIAGVLAMRPTCIVLDEPTAMLDPSGRREVLEAITTLNREGITIILITHFMEEAALAGRVIVMHEGRAVLDDTPKAVFSQVETMLGYELSVPPVTLLAYKLREEGLDVGGDLITVEEFAGDQVVRGVLLGNAQACSGANGKLTNDCNTNGKPITACNTNGKPITACNTNGKPITACNTNGNLIIDIVGADLVSARACENHVATPQLDGYANCNLSGRTQGPPLQNVRGFGHTCELSTMDIASGREDPAPTVCRADTGGLHRTIGQAMIDKCEVYCADNSGPSNNSPPIIQIQNPSHTYSPGSAFEMRALEDINLSINQGEMVAIIGHTGSGKSTLIQHLNALLAPTQGRILIEGTDIHADKSNLKAVRQKVGLVFQYPEHQLFESTVYRDVAFGPTRMGLTQEEIDAHTKEALTTVGVGQELYEKSPFELSGGQKRRVAIAGVLAMRPKILILDEPAAGLDPKGRDEILTQIKHMHVAYGLTVILVSHSMDDAARLTDRVIVLNQGKALYDDTPAQVFSHASKLTEIGLDIPQISMLANRLGAINPAIRGTIFSLDELSRELLALAGKGGALT